MCLRELELICSRILLFPNANGFASLVLLNSKWRRIAKNAKLYAYHLSRCPSYSAAHPGIVEEEDLSRLQRLFAREVKRNLFESFLRPQETVINLVSTSISSSATPESFHFSISPKGRYVLAYSSSRIHILDVAAEEVEVVRELGISRRPLCSVITDSGSLLAVLSDLQVDIYDLTGERPKHVKAVILDHTPRSVYLTKYSALNWSFTIISQWGMYLGLRML